MKKLLKLEKSRKYLFHGSSSGDIQQLVPRQARTQGKNDGRPCVAASEYYEPAVFKAILGSKQLGGWRTNNDATILYYLLRTEYEKARKEKWSGYIYILARDEALFTQRKGWEWRAYADIEPVDVVKVGMENLPKNIELLENYEQYYEIARRMP